MTAKWQYKTAYESALVTNAELRAKNAKLRDLMYEKAHERSIQHMTEDELRIMATSLMSENEKLRELAKKLKACNSSCGRCIELYGSCDYETELRELGIEVNDA